MPHLHSHDDLVRLAFNEVRRVAAPHPAVCIYLLEALHLLGDAAQEATPNRMPAVIVEQAKLVVEGAEAEGLIPADIDDVRRAYALRFNMDDGASATA